LPPIVVYIIGTSAKNDYDSIFGIQVGRETERGIDSILKSKRDLAPKRE
jgi:hypothetical protein